MQIGLDLAVYYANCAGFCVALNRDLCFTRDFYREFESRLGHLMESHMVANCRNPWRCQGVFCAPLNSEASHCGEEINSGEKIYLATTWTIAQLAAVRIC